MRLQLKYKFDLVLAYISPIISIILPIIIMGTIFSFNVTYGEWTIDNFLVYQFIAYNISLLKAIMTRFSTYLRQEVILKTLPIILIAPFKTINLIFGIFFTHFILISIPFIVFSLICYIYYPISFLTFFFMLMLYFLTAFIFSGIGIIFGIVAVRKYQYLGLSQFFVNLVFMFSCVSFPFEIFPEVLQKIINLNPLYYFFDLLRTTWIDNNVLFTINEHFDSLIILILIGIIFPLISLFFFTKLYRKYGIEGA